MAPSAIVIALVARFCNYYIAVLFLQTDGADEFENSIGAKRKGRLCSSLRSGHIACKSNAAGVQKRRANRFGESLTTCVAISAKGGNADL